MGWAIDPKLRDKKNWRNTRLLGKQFDQALMDLDGKMSQGIPIGVDISFLLAEIVLGQVDKAVRIPKDRAVRWYDDYEVAFNSRSDAEATLKKLNRELSRYRLRLNPKKTAILALPRASQEDWRQTLIESILGSFVTPNLMVSYFDTAFRLRERYPDTDILLYSLGRLFKIQRPSVEVGRIAESCITQALLSEPGCAQKAFALLSYWALNGYRLNIDLIRRTIESVILRHAAGGLSSDVAWSLAFCLDQKIYLGRDAAKLLSILDDDCIALQALHMNSVGLLPNGFSDKGIAKELAKSDLDREHWLLAYESVRHNFMNTCAPLIAKNSLFSDLLKQRVTFYRTSLPSYAMVIQPGSASDWLVKSWLGSIEKRAAKGADAVTVPPMVELLEKDAPRVLHDKMSPEGIRLSFLNVESDELGFEFDGGSY